MTHRETADEIAVSVFGHNPGDLSCASRNLSDAIVAALDTRVEACRAACVALLWQKPEELFTGVVHNAAINECVAVIDAIKETK